MDFNDSAEEAGFRSQVRQFLDAHARVKTPEEAQLPRMVNPVTAREWQAKKADAGFAAIRLPSRYGGRDGTAMQQLIYEEEEARYLVPAQGMLFTIGLGMCIPTMIAYASEAHLDRYVKPALRGDEIWCQLFSEPSGGSDVAALRTRATREGDVWTVHGQKVWTSGAHIADYGLLLARSDPSQAKHAGLTAFFIDMKAPGIEVRPIRQMNGEATFNEVFFTDLKVPDANRLGAEGEGWKVALHTLMNERLAVGRASGVVTTENAIGLARSLWGSEDAGAPSGDIKQRLADAYSREAGVRLTGFRVMTALSKGKAPGPEASLIKYMRAALQTELTNLMLDMQGPAGMTTAELPGSLGEATQNWWLRAPGEHIAGGTDEILLNVIAERVLGLPGDSRPDRRIPFNQLSKD
jgi:alkylation response protein AidB-like acyl-CoA dehydrogenase